MPPQRCSIRGKRGWRFGSRGKCYVGEGAMAKVMRQAKAIRATGWTENVLGKNGNGSPNPLRRDPTRTTMLRKRFQGELTKRWRRIKGQIIELIVREDALGLKMDLRVIRASLPVLHQRWAFRSDAQKLIEFRRWLEGQFAGEILSQQAERAYWDAYIEEGWRSGAGRVFDDVKGRAGWEPGEGEFYKGSKQQFLADSFNIPVSREKVKLLAGRTYTDLKGVTEQAATRMSRVLTDGLVQGKNPRVVARELNKELDLGRKRSLTIARTETIRAHAEGQLDAMEMLGVEEIGVAVEWSTSGLGITRLGNPSPCPLCAPLKGVVMTVKEARGLLPRHPDCRCSYIPANVGETRTEEQKRTEGEISGAIDRSLKAEAPSKRTLAEQRQRSKWAGADKTIRKRRPQELVPERVRPKPSVKPPKPKLTTLQRNELSAAKDLAGRAGLGEKAFTFDAKTGLQEIEIMGDEYSVRFEVQDLKNPNGLVLMHSHPDPSSFSVADWNLFRHREDLKRFTVETNKGSYILEKKSEADRVFTKAGAAGRKPPEVVMQEELDRLKVSKELKARNKNLFFEGKKLPERVDIISEWQYHEANKKVAEVYSDAVTYRRVENAGDLGRFRDSKVAGGAKETVGKGGPTGG